MKKITVGILDTSRIFLIYFNGEINSFKHYEVILRSTSAKEFIEHLSSRSTAPDIYLVDFGI